MRVIVAGRGTLGLDVMRRILEAGYEVPFVVTTRPTPEVLASTQDFKDLAKRYSIPYYYTTNLHKPEFIELFQKVAADITLALLWPQTLRSEIIRTTRLGFLNLHGADLPRYRGNACGNWALLQGESKFGVCVHFMDPDSLDSGPILEREDIAITERMTIGELMDKVKEKGVSILMKGMERLRNGDYSVESQSQASAFRCYPRLPQDGEIDWSQSAQQIDRHVRSVSEPYPGAYTFFRGAKMIVWRAHPVEDPPPHLAVPGHVVAIRGDGGVWVATGHNGIITLEQVQLDGQEITRPASFMKSIREHLGLDVTGEITALKKRIDELEQKLTDRVGSRA